MKLDTAKISNASIADVDFNDHPNYVDAYLDSADYEDRKMTEEELDWVKDNCLEWIHEQVIENYGR